MEHQDSQENSKREDNVEEPTSDNGTRKMLFQVETVMINDESKSSENLNNNFTNNIESNFSTNNHINDNTSLGNHFTSPLNSNNISGNHIAKYICNVPDCFKEYKSIYNLRKHMRSHNGDILFVCNYEGCNKSYKIKENLELHVKNFHLKEKPFKCGFCFKKFSHRNGKLYHEKKKHLNILEFKCDREGCKAAFASRSARKYHMTHQHL